MKLTAKGLAQGFAGLVSVLVAVALVASAQTKKVGSALGGGGNADESKGSFAGLFAPQRVTLFRSPASGLPKGFTLTPYFDQSGSLRLAFSDVIYDSQTPTTPVTWRVLNTLLDGRDGVSVSLENDKHDVLLLSGILGPGNTASGIWRSTTAQSGEQHGEWSSQRSTRIKPINYPEYSWWTFLLDPTDGAQAETVAVQFEPLAGDSSGVYRDAQASIPVPFQQATVLPAGWRADQLQLAPTGMEMRLISPAGQTYCLKEGSFSGALDHLVCRGTWQSAAGLDCDPSQGEAAALPSTGEQKQPKYIQIRDALPKNEPTIFFADGTWTGTSGGPGR